MIFVIRLPKSIKENKMSDSFESMNTISVEDVLETYRNYDASEEAKEPVLYFISELTGLSVDSILERL